MRSTAVIVFIVAIAGVALYCARRPTVARGDALAATLIEANPTLRSMTCEDRVPIGIDGATFSCHAEFKNGDGIEYKFQMNREGNIKALDHGETTSKPRIKKTSDPWGE